MSYQKQTWIDDVDNYTPITAERLNHMEAGIGGANDAWDSICPSTATGVVADSFWVPVHFELTRIGKRAYMRLHITYHISTSLSGSHVGTIPVGFRPPSGTGLIPGVIAGAAYSPATIEVWSDGRVTAYTGGASGADLICSCSWDCA